MSAQPATATPARTRRSLKKRLTGTLAATALIAGLGFADVSSASATSLAYYPQFGCYKTSTGGIIRGDKLNVNHDGKSTVYLAYAYRWSGTTWQAWTSLYNPRGGTSVAFQDTIFGALTEDSLQATVTHGYYQVVYYMESTGDTQWQVANARELDTPSTRYDSITCLL